jgi:AcrR family transcriptional regulator
MKNIVTITLETVAKAARAEVDAARAEGWRSPRRENIAIRLGVRPQEVYVWWNVIEPIFAVARRQDIEALRAAAEEMVEEYEQGKIGNGELSLAALSRRLNLRPDFLASQNAPRRRFSEVLSKINAAFCRAKGRNLPSESARKTKKLTPKVVAEAASAEAYAAWEDGWRVPTKKRVATSLGIAPTNLARWREVIDSQFEAVSAEQSAEITKAAKAIAADAIRRSNKSILGFAELSRRVGTKESYFHGHKDRGTRFHLAIRDCLAIFEEAHERIEVNAQPPKTVKQMPLKEIAEVPTVPVVRCRRCIYKGPVQSLSYGLCTECWDDYMSAVAIDEDPAMRYELRRA